MLRFITGAVHGGADEAFCRRIKQACDNGENVLVMIPDQFSFEYDKKLYSLMGPRDFNRIKTAGFNRLAQLISRSCGGGSKENANENARIITMYKAIRRLRETGDVRYYRRALDKGSFMAQMISLISEMIQSGIAPADLQIASERLEGAVCEKLFDLYRLYEFYLEELSKAGLKDALTSMGECARLVKDTDYFEGMSIFIDAFTSFTQDEYRLIEQMLIRAKSVTVSLVISGEENAKIPRTPFAGTIRTRDRIQRLAMLHNVPFEEECVSSFDYKASAIEHINRSLYLMKPQTLESHEGVTLLSGNEIYEETEYVCAEIMRLVREEGYRFSEIAVAARDLGEISAVLEGTFERYDIPYFIDSRQSAEQSALAIYLRSIFDCVLTSQYRTENILKYIKSPLCAVYDYDVCELEDYCIKWSVEGNMWLEDLPAAESRSEPDPRVNEVRRMVIEPLERFKSACNDAAAGEICRALYELLEEIKLSEQIYSVVKRASGSSNDTDLELGRAFRQLWQTVLGAVQSIYENMADEKITLRRFYELFRLMVSQMTVSAPPQKIDSVRCAGAERSRLTNVRALFVIEVNDGVFPADVKQQGLLTERERRQMEEIGVRFDRGLATSLENERLTAYLTLSMPSERLYMISSESDLQGGAKKPSPLIKMVSSMFEDLRIVRIGDISPDFFCTSYKTAYYKYLELSKDETAVIKPTDTPTPEKQAADNALRRRADLIASVKASAASDKDYKSRLDWVRESAAAKPYRISEETAKKLFFGADLNISATKVDKFYNCPFMYFCTYGLKLYGTKQVAFNQMIRGRILHSCLERIMSRELDGRNVYNEGFLSMSESEIRESIHNEFTRYIAEEMGGQFGKGSRFIYEAARYEKTAFHLVRLVQEELKGTLFKPEAFEFDLNKENGGSILSITLDKGYTLHFRGSIDRADIYVDGSGRRLLRIVDYKTGSTAFDIAQLYNGLNLQMLIYLLAVTKSVNRLSPDGKLVPAGIMYAHVREFRAKRDPGSDTDDKALLLERAGEVKPDGVMTDDNDVIGALNHEYGGAFSMFNFNKDMSISRKGAQPVPEKYLTALEEFALQKVYDMADRLFRGEIEADPLQTGSGRRAKIPCTYCDYFGICGRGDPKDSRKATAEDAESLEKELEQITEDMEKKEKEAAENG